MAACQWALPVVLLLVTSLPQTFSVQNHFRSGNIRTQVLTSTGNITKVEVTVTSAWRIDASPCGGSCNYQDIGLSTTNVRRDMIMRSQTSNEFGQFFLSTDPTTHTDITTDVTSDSHSVVYDVNTQADWAEEDLTFNLTLDTDGSSSIVISMVGASWPTLKQNCTFNLNNGCLYHLQSKLVLGTRNDTLKPNRPPLLSYSPVYHVPLDTPTKLTVHVADRDGDMTSCRWPSGTQEDMGLTPHSDVTLHDDCTMTVTLDHSRHADADFIAVSFMVDEIAVHPIGMDTGSVFGARAVISTTQVDFSIQVVAAMSVPVFVPGFFSPCGGDPKKGRRSYATHIGQIQQSFLFLPMLAKPGNLSSPDTEIERFRVMSRPNLDLQVTPPQDMPPAPGQTGDRQRMTDLTATFTRTEGGSHWVKVEPVDSKGQVGQACTLSLDVNVVDYTPRSGTPFIGIPEPQDITCPLYAQCDFPVYIASAPDADEIDLTIKSFDPTLQSVTINSEVDTTLRNISSTRFQIYLTGTSPGSRDICFLLKLPTMTESQCVQIEVTAPDPCIKVDHPCTSPAHGACHVNLTMPEEYYCQCELGFAGPKCQTPVDPCTEGYCGANSNSCTFNRLTDRRPACDCFSNYTGSQCGQPILCFQNPCQPHGECIPHATTFTCSCKPGYGGSLCEDPVGSLLLSTNMAAVTPHLTETLTLTCSFIPMPGSGATLVWLSMFFSPDGVKEHFQELATVTVDSGGVAKVILQNTGLGDDVNATGVITQVGDSYLQLNVIHPMFTNPRYFRCDAEDVDAHGPLVRSSEPVQITSQKAPITVLQEEIKALRKTRDALIKECKMNMTLTLT